MKLTPEILRFLDNQRQWLIELPPEEVKKILNSSIYGQMPENLREIVDEIMKEFPGTKLRVGNEYSRVLYVVDIQQHNSPNFISLMKKLGDKYNTDESDADKFGWRFWWD